MAPSSPTTPASWPAEDALTRPEIERLLELRRHAVLATSRTVAVVSGPERPI